MKERVDMYRTARTFLIQYILICRDTVTGV